MRILITGATGLIGSALTKILVTKHQLTVLSRNSAKAEQLLGKQIKAIAQLAEADFNQLDVIINLAGEPIAAKRWTEAQKREIERSRWQITQELADRIKSAQRPPHTFISGSAIGVYGRQGSEPIAESYQNCHPEFTHELCKKWEQIAQSAASAATRVCLVRTGIVLAPKGGALEKMLPAFKFGVGGPFAGGTQFMSWIHIEDMVQLLIYLVENRQLSGPVNATAPNPVSNAEFSKTLASALNRPCFLRMPKIVLKMLLGELSDVLIYGQKVIPEKLLNAGFTFRYPDLQTAMAQILGK